MAFLQKLSRWLLTETGKKCVYYVTGVTSVGIVTAKTVPNTFLLDNYKSFMQLYKNGVSQPLDPEIKNRFKKALDLAEVPPEERFLYHPFHVFGFDMFHTGTTYSQYGALIGIPINFTYKDVDSIDKSELRVNAEPVPWGTPEATSLLNSLVLSEKAQLYAMVRDIKICSSPKFLLDTLYVIFPLPFYYGITSTINQKFNLYSRPLLVRFLLYSLSGLLTFGYYVFFKDFTQTYFETKIDKEIKEKHPELAEGGKEFYDKIIKRNVALRTLMGKVGESKFTATGNENYLIRRKHVPLSDRKVFFEKGEAA